jgi:DNA-binding transcriptional MerR regulator
MKRRTKIERIDEGRTFTTTEVIYDSQRAKAFGSQFHRFTKKYAHILHKPRFTVKGSRKFVEGITYRKVNDWDDKGLVSGTREGTESGWRKFSIAEIVQLNVVSDLRKFGFPTDKIKRIIDRITDSQFKFRDVIGKLHTKRFLELEFSIFACLHGNKILLLVDEYEQVYFLDERSVIGGYMMLDRSSSPLLILPLFSYVERIAGWCHKEIKVRPDSTAAELLRIQLTEKEKTILDIIRNEDYEQVTITKPGGDRMTLRAKRRDKGSFSDEEVIDAINARDYQKVTVSRVDGKKTTIVREETFKV